MSTMKRIALLIGLVSVFGLASCGLGRQTEQGSTPDPEAAQEQSLKPSNTAHSAASTPKASEPEASNEPENAEEERMRMFIGSTEVSVEWETNESVDALCDMVKAEPLVMDMSMYGGFEQVGSLGASLPRNDVQTTAQAGDIMLYSGNRIVVFYGSNSWAYTRLGRIANMNSAELAELLGNGSVKITILYGGK